MKNRITLPELMHFKSALETAESNLAHVRSRYEGCELSPEPLEFRSHDAESDNSYRLKIYADKYLVSFIIEKHIERLGEIVSDARCRYERAEVSFYKQLRSKLGEVKV